jgi:hypothetical protein
LGCSPSSLFLLLVHPLIISRVLFSTPELPTALAARMACAMGVGIACRGIVRRKGAI